MDRIVFAIRCSPEDGEDVMEVLQRLAGFLFGDAAVRRASPKGIEARLQDVLVLELLMKEHRPGHSDRRFEVELERQEEEA